MANSSTRCSRGADCDCCGARSGGRTALWQILPPTVLEGRTATAAVPGVVLGQLYGKFVHRLF
eukprot:1191821-Prorocentrum_minimum.AAC.2